MIRRVHYPDGMLGRCRRLRLTPITIDIGGTMLWQGGVTEQEVHALAEIMRDIRLAHPPSEIAPQEMEIEAGRPPTMTIPGMDAAAPEVEAPRKKRKYTKRVRA